MNLKTKVGWLLLGLSLCCTAVVFSLPFSGLPGSIMAWGILAATITGKVLFAGSAFCLGRPVIEKLKRRLHFWKKRSPEA